MSNFEYARPGEVPEVLREALYWHEIFRTLGVPPGDLFLDNSRLPRVAVVVRQGSLRMGVLAAGELSPYCDVMVAWPAAVDLWNRTCNADDSGWDIQGSAARRAALGVAADFIAAGFRFAEDLRS